MKLGAGRASEVARRAGGAAAAALGRGLATAGWWRRGRANLAAAAAGLVPGAGGQRPGVRRPAGARV